jgi:mRNA-degrading endonuclease RelE of RelBE toxin-antitoxin system
MWRSPVTIAETMPFVRDVERLFDTAEADEMKSFLAWNPEAGVVIPGAGGIRKLRWGQGSRGKRGGARIIYYFHSAAIPLYLLAAYGKNERADLDHAARKAMQDTVAAILGDWRSRRRTD